MNCGRERERAVHRRKGNFHNVVISSAGKGELWVVREGKTSETRTFETFLVLVYRGRRGRSKDKCGEIELPQMN